MTWQFSIAGLLIGVLVGMTGMGGGSLMTPMLILLFGFDPKAAVGTDILHGAVFKSFGAVRHRQLGNVHVPLALWMLVGSAPLSLVGVQIASSFSDGTQSTMAKVVGGDADRRRVRIPREDLPARACDRRPLRSRAARPSVRRS